MSSHRHSGMSCDYGALDLEQEKDIGGATGERFKIALPLGENQVGCFEAAAELLATIVENRTWGVRAVIDDFNDFMKPCGPRVNHSRIVDDRGAAHSQRDAQRQKLFDDR